MSEQASSAALAKALTEELKAELRESPNSINAYHMRTWSAFEKRLAAALEAAKPSAAAVPAQNGGAEKMRTAILAAKGKFSEFFKLANAGNQRGAGMSIMAAETLLTASLIADPKPVAKTSSKSRKPS